MALKDFIESNSFTKETSTESVDTDKRIAVMSLCGGIGKTTLTRFLFYPRMKDARLFNIETINLDGQEQGTVVSGDDFQAVLNELAMLNSAVVDVGASNVELAMQEMRKLEDSHEEIDLFVIPVTGMERQIADAIDTAKFLRNIGVEPNRIRFVFNMVDKPEKIPAVFDKVFYAANNMGIAVNEKAYVPLTRFFTSFSELGLPLQQLIDYDTGALKARKEQLREKSKKALTKNEESEFEKVNLILSTQKQAKNFIRELDRAFYEILKPTA